MQTTYFKRLRMEIKLRRLDLSEPVLPDGFEWRPWHPVLVESHARVKFESFQGEVDSIVFPSLSSLPGCRQLMSDISLRRGFIAPATWLICRSADDFGGPHPCATIQGVHLGWRRGSIQNVGVVPDCRGFGLGRALLIKSLLGFRERGVRKVCLQVTADNIPALELYRSLGFRHRRTLYKSVVQSDELLAAS